MASMTSLPVELNLEMTSNSSIFSPHLLYPKIAVTVYGIRLAEIHISCLFVKEPSSIQG